MSIFLVDAFTNQRFTGNRAGVVLDSEGYSRDIKQKIAAELNASETVFARRLGPSEFEAVYFTPTTEIEFCGHATIALFYTLAKYGKLDTNSATIRTKAGTFPIAVEKKSDGDILVTMRQTQAQYAEAPCSSEELANALHLPEEAFDERLPVGLARTGNWHLIVGLTSKSYLEQIDYDPATLSEILMRAQAVTLHAFCQEDAGTFNVRNFGPTIGIPEDPATGSAAGAFAAYLVHEGLIADGRHDIRIVQGEKMGRKSQIDLRIDCENRILKQVEITGSAAISFELSLPPVAVSGAVSR